MGESRKGFESGCLKETLCVQQKLLQKLYHELEVERESSATAASEALSMILKLQGEKAAVKMEAEQYKRLAEEKMCHAEESLSIFEDLIYQKEMEVASLDYQVQAYRYKLLSMGCDSCDDDHGIGEVKLPENLSLQRNEIKFPENLLQRNQTLIADISAQTLGRRNSAPPSALKNAYLKGIVERENSFSPERDLMSKIMENEVTDQGLDSEWKPDTSSVLGINSYWEQIKKLDGRIKEFAHLHTPSQLNSHEDLVKDSVENEIVKDSASSSGVLDVFEVPQADQPKDEGKGVQRRDNYAPLEARKTEMLDESDWLKKLLKSTRAKKLPSTNYDNNASNDYNWAAILQPIASAGESHQPINTTSEIVEVETQDSREEELNLLNEIKDQLNAIESEIRSLRIMKSLKRDKMATLSFMEVSLKEAMLSFWI